MTSERLKRWWKSPKGCYHKHKFNAKHRGVAFLLNFEEWWTIWEASGKWERRGRGRGQYVMARFGDQGAYERGNVRICLASENLGERNRNYPMSSEQASARVKAAWAAAAPEKREGWVKAIAKANIGKRIGRTHSPEARAKMRASAKRVLPQRVRNELGQWANSEID